MPSTERDTKNQHYVWAHYLDGWNAEGKFCCYRQKNKKLFPTQPKVIANENFFYETELLTAVDLAFLESIIEKATNEGLRDLHREFVQMTQLTFRLRDALQGVDLPADKQAEVERELRWIEKNLVERYHAGIEGKCVDILASLRRTDDIFYGDPKRCTDFTYFLSLQYFRTPKMRNEVIRFLPDVQGQENQRTAKILNHIYATNVGASLFAQRTAYRIVFLRNDTQVPFIAGDQPVVNMLDPLKTIDLALYYPLSPRLAMILTKDATLFPERERKLTLFEVERYNYAIYSRSDDQIYANDAAYLRSLVAVGKDALAP